MEDPKLEPWEAHPELWKSKSAFMSYIRGCLRKAWKNHPVKISYINTVRRKIKNPNPNGKKPEVWGYECECCGNVDVIKTATVDHIVPAGSLRSKEDIQAFTENLLFVTFDDIQLLCPECHGIKTYQEKMGITFEEAKVEKKVIEFSRMKVDKMKNFFESKGKSVDKLKKADLIGLYRDMVRREDDGI